MSTCARLGWLKTMDHRNPVRSEAPLRIPDAPQSRLFYNEAGLRSGWRILIYLGQAMVLAVVVNLLLARFVHAHKDMAPPWLMFIDEVAWLLPVFVPVLFMARLERRPPGAYGLPSEGLFGARFWQGCALGAVEIVVLVGAIAAFGGYSFGRRSLSGPQVLVWALFWALFFVVVGLFEEFTFRGYLQYTLGDGIGFWPAAWILSLGFGAVHLMNQGESLVGAASVATIGLVFALALKRTGNLWLAVGWHAAFDFGETFVFSVPNSGMVFQGRLSDSSLHGPSWLTGGTVGPEGSFFSFLTMGLAALFIHKVFPAAKRVPPPATGENIARAAQ
jgi:membrane protease YdiL (CAAX protease family)